MLGQRAARARTDSSIAGAHAHGTHHTHGCEQQRPISRSRARSTSIHAQRAQVFRYHGNGREAAYAAAASGEAEVLLTTYGQLRLCPDRFAALPLHVSGDARVRRVLAASGRVLCGGLGVLLWVRFDAHARAATLPRHMLSNAFTCAHIQRCTPCMRVCLRARAHTYTHEHTHTHTHTHTHIHIRTHTHAHAHTHARTHTQNPQAVIFDEVHQLSSTTAKVALAARQLPTRLRFGMSGACGSVRTYLLAFGGGKGCGEGG